MAEDKQKQPPNIHVPRLRPPCFQIAVEGDGKESRRTTKEVSVAEYVKHQMQRKYRHPLLFDDDDDEEVDTEHNQAGGNDSTPSNKSLDDKAEQNDGFLPMDQCVAILEPHLEAFRKLNVQLSEQKQKQDAKVKKRKMKDVDQKKKSKFEIPAQLLRLARFFKWR